MITDDQDHCSFARYELKFSGMVNELFDSFSQIWTKPLKTDVFGDKIGQYNCF